MAKRRNNDGTRPSASIHVFRDTDLMVKLSSQGASGATAADIAEDIGFGEDGTQALAIRFSWMRRMGMVEYDSERHLWTVTEGGERVIEARSRASAMKKVQAIPDEAMVEVMADISNRYIHGDEMLAHMLRREFVFGTSRRR